MTSWTLQCFSSIFNNSTSLDGDNIILPTSILTDITSNDDIIPPYIFNITHDKTSQCVTCVAIEFTNDTDIVYVPNWIMQNLFPLNDGDSVIIRLDTNITNNKCGLLKIQPHDSIFITLDDHRSLMEAALVNFNTLTSGTTISIKHADLEFNIDIVSMEDLSGNTVTNGYIIDTDVEVDFLPPHDYVEIKPDHWPPLVEWPLPYDVNIIEEIIGRPTKYVLSDGRQIEGTNVPAPAPAPTPDSNPSGFVPFSGKGNKLGN